jgi:hypothetical protein
VIAPDGKSSRVLDEDLWAVYGWGRDGSTVYGIKQDPDDPHRLMLVAANIDSGQLRIINRDLSPVPPANQPVKGFTRMPNGNFATSLVRVRSDVWLIEHFDPPRTWLERLGAGLKQIADRRP